MCVCLSDGDTAVSKKGTLGGKTASVEATSVSGGAGVEGQFNHPKTLFVPCQGSNWRHTEQRYQTKADSLIGVKYRQIYKNIDKK